MRIRNNNDALTAQQVKTLLEGIDNPKDKLMIEMGIYSGCRINEIRNLRTENCDFVNNTIKVWDNKHNRWVYKKELNQNTGKKIKDYKINEGKWRTVAIPSKIMEQLKQYISQNPTQPEAVRLDQYGKSDGDSTGTTTYVWTTYYITWERRLQHWT